MVLGNGLVANGFNTYKYDENYLVFASGVSNSGNTHTGAFGREHELLSNTILANPEKTLIYFSTCSIYDDSLKNSDYVKHKLAMESLLKKKHGSFHIFRISNLAGKTNNPHTVLNYFIQHIRSGKFFYAWENASRNIIGMDDAYSICDYIIQQKMFMNEAVNVANTKNYPVPEIIRVIETVFNKKGNYELMQKGSNPLINISPIEPIITKLNISFNDDYLAELIRKYHPVI